MPPRTSGFLKAMFSAAVIVAALLLVACGSPSPTPTAGAPTPAPTGSVIAVDIVNFSFSPATITVPSGTTVTWTNKDSVSHNVVSDDGALFDSGILRQSATFSFTFTKSGAFPFHCSPHPTMKGTVFVQ